MIKDYSQILYLIEFSVVWYLAFFDVPRKDRSKYIPGLPDSILEACDDEFN